MFISLCFYVCMLWCVVTHIYQTTWHDCNHCKVKVGDSLKTHGATLSCTELGWNHGADSPAGKGLNRFIRLRSHTGRKSNQANVSKSAGSRTGQKQVV